MCHRIYSVLSSTLQSATAFNAKPVKVRCWKYFAFAWILVCVFLFFLSMSFYSTDFCVSCFFFSMASPRFILNIIWLTSLCKFYMFFVGDLFMRFDITHDSIAMKIFTIFHLLYFRFHKEIFATTISQDLSRMWTDNECDVSTNLLIFWINTRALKYHKCSKFEWRKKWATKKLKDKNLWKNEQKEMDKSKRKVEGKKQKSLGHEKKPIENYFLLTMVLSSRSGGGQR